MARRNNLFRHSYYIVKNQENLAQKAALETLMSKYLIAVGQHGLLFRTRMS